jgi:hypothetical protein
VSLFLFNVMFINCSWLRLFHFICIWEMVLASLLWRHNLDIVHIHFVNSIVCLRSISNKHLHFLPIELSKYVSSKLIVWHKVSCLMFPNEFVHVGINRNFVFIQLFSELVDIDVSLSVVLYDLCHLLLIRIAWLLKFPYTY